MIANGVDKPPTNNGTPPVSEARWKRQEEEHKNCWLHVISSNHGGSPGEVRRRMRSDASSQFETHTHTATSCRLCGGVVILSQETSSSCSTSVCSVACTLAVYCCVLLCSIAHLPATVRLCVSVCIPYIYFFFPAFFRFRRTRIRLLLSTD